MVTSAQLLLVGFFLGSFLLWFPCSLVLSINMTDPDYSDMPDLVSFETDASDSDGSESETVLERCVVCVL